MADTLNHTFNIKQYIVGIILVIFVFSIVSGGLKRLSKVTEKMIPIMAFVYILGSIVVICFYHEHILTVLSTIFKDAFGIQSIAGGALGYSVKNAMRYGIARGLYSNEAGEGSAPVLHSSANVKTAHDQAGLE